MKVAIVTASSRGIGAACARELASSGYSLVLMSRSEQIHAVAAEVGAVAIQGSVTNTADIERVVDAAMNKFNQVDAVINNSGDPAGGEITAITDQQWSEVFEMYFLSVVRMARLVTPIMLKQGKGSIVNISGCDANEPDLRFPVASTIRASMAAYRKLYSRQYAQFGIRMNCLMPSVVMDFDPNTIREDIKKEIPMGRPARYKEVDKAALFLVSDDASYITGHGLRVDGGVSKAL